MHDNITHALRAIAANEGRFLLTGAAIRRIVYSVTGREYRTGSWTRGFGRQVGKLWEPATESPFGDEPEVCVRCGVSTEGLPVRCRYCGNGHAEPLTGRCSNCGSRIDHMCPYCGFRGVKITSKGSDVYRLTPEGRLALKDEGSYDPSAYDALAWFDSDLDFYSADTPREIGLWTRKGSNVERFESKITPSQVKRPRKYHHKGRW